MSEPSRCAVVTKDSPRPEWMTGRDWRNLRSSMRKMGSRSRAYWRDAWSYIRERGTWVDRLPASEHPARLTMRAAVECHGLREASL